MKNKLLTLSIPRSLFIAFACITFFQTACSSILNSLDQYSGETLYDAATESNGEILDFIPGIKSEVDKYLKSEEQRREFQVFQQELITKLIKENPGFVKEFRENLHSNDRDKINKALSDAGTLLEKELRVITGKSDVTAKSVVNAVLENSDV
jgi:hypothetical protein